MESLEDIPDEIIYQILEDLSPLEIYNLYRAYTLNGYPFSIAIYILRDIKNKKILITEQEKIIILNEATRVAPKFKSICVAWMF